MKKAKRDWIRLGGCVVAGLVALGAQRAAGAGVTIITHGWNAGGAPQWMASMSDAISDNFLSDEQNYGTITVTGSVGSLTVTCSPWNVDLSSGTNGEILIVLDWSAVADHLTGGPSAQDVAAVVVDKLVTGQNGKPALAKLPIHLVGHSRGGGMVCELARLLGERGIVVDQLTPLDPHPLTTSDPQPTFPSPYPTVIDTPAAIYENVVFADVYSQTNEYPMGEYLSGGYNRLWNAMTGGYHTDSQPYANHRNVYLMYQGTIDLANPVNNGEASMDAAERAAWFNAHEAGGDATGFTYSRIDGGGDRSSTNTPVAGGDAVRAGLNDDAAFGGGGSRVALTWGSAVWPNVAALDVLSGGTSLGSGPHDILVGSTQELRTVYLDYDSGCTVTLRLDADRDPYNSNDVATVATRPHGSATGGAYAQDTADWDTASIPAGTIGYVYAEVTDGTHTRYFYAAPELRFTASPMTAPGNCLEFDGTNDYAEGNGISSALTNITIEAWVKHRSLGSANQRYVTIGSEVAVIRYGVGAGHDRLQFYLKTDGIIRSLSVDGVLTTGTWHHVAGTWDGTDMKLYLDGTLLTNSAPGGTLDAPAGYVQLSSSGEMLDGYLDEVRVWSVARTQSELLANMRQELTGTEPGLEYYWNMNQISGTTVYDAADSVNLTLYNMEEPIWVASDAPLSVDFGDAPAPYPTLASENGAYHIASGPTLGATRDTEADGTHSAAADADGSDEDGVSGWTNIAVGSAAATVAVNVRNAPSGAKLDAWVDWNRDGSWGGAFDHIAQGVAVTNGDNLIAFDVPSDALAGATYARFRLSTAGGLGVSGPSDDGEVEDYQVAVTAPAARATHFPEVRETDVSASGVSLQTVESPLVAGDLDGDGVTDLALQLGTDDIRYYENGGAGGFTMTSQAGSFETYDLTVADVDGDSDLDLIGSMYILENDGTPFDGLWPSNQYLPFLGSPSMEPIADVNGDGHLDVFFTTDWYENDGTPFDGIWPSHAVGGQQASATADIDADGDMDAVAGLNATLEWYENDGAGNFITHAVATSLTHIRNSYLADLNGDGHMDILAVGQNDAAIAWYENDGSENFTEHVVSISPCKPLGAAVADLDGDGDPDIGLALDDTRTDASTSDQIVMWLENDGSGNFSAHFPVGTGLSGEDGYAVVAADLNGDGYPDLALVTSKAKLLWYPNMDAVPPTVTNRVPVPGGSVSVTTTVLNVDITFSEAVTNVDATDLVLGGSASPYASVGTPEDLGGHTWRLAIAGLESGSLDLTLAPDAGDIRDLAYNDLASLSWSYTVTVYRDLGDAPASYPVTVAENGARHAPVGPTLGTTRDSETNGVHSAAADADGGDEDGVSGWVGVQVGKLDAQVTVNVQNAPSGAKLDAWIDWNADGNWGGMGEQIAASVSVVNGDNTIRFDVPAWAASGTTYARFRLSTAGRSGITGHADDGEVEDYSLDVQPPASGSGFFSDNVVVYDGGSTYVRYDHASAADLNGDGYMDLFGLAEETTWHWSENDGSQDFTTRTVPIGDSNSWWSAMTMEAADVDGDGDLDIVVGSRFGVFWAENDGGNPSSWTVYSLSSNSSYGTPYAYPVDMNGDGRIDIVCTSGTSGSDKILWFENDGSQPPVWTEHVLVSAIKDFYGLQAVDLDGDGDQDIVSLLQPSSGSGSSLMWYENDGSRNFSTNTLASNDVSSVVTVVAGDLNGDGHMDLLVGFDSGSGKAVVWYENDGAQSFTEHTIVTDIYAHSVSAADMDGDGDLDVLVADRINQTVDVYSNDGSGSFVRTSSLTADQPTGAAAADVDGDGDLDIVTVSGVKMKIGWFEQRLPHIVVSAGDHGTITPTGAVEVAFGGTTNFVITPDTYWHVGDVTTNGASVGAVTAFTWSNVVADGTIHATFAADLAAHGTPHWWLASFGLTNGGWTFDQAETNNPDNDPFNSGDEYIADTNPHDSNDFFRVTDITHASPFAVHFHSSTGRLYTLEGVTNLLDGVWTNVPGSGPRMGAGDADWMEDTNEPPSGPFYRLGVELP